MIVWRIQRSDGPPTHGSCDCVKAVRLPPRNLYTLMKLLSPSLLVPLLCCVQSVAVWRLLYDERPIRFRDQDEEQVWLCFNRRCGLTRSQAKLVGQGREREASALRQGEGGGSGEREVSLTLRQAEAALMPLSLYV